MLIRPIEPDEYARLGVLTLEAYTTLDGHVSEPDYEEDLADVRTRAEAPATVVLVAVGDEGGLLGGVTYVADERSPYAEHSVDGAASIRMLAVDGSARRSGAGEALVRECINRARADGRAEVFLHSTPWMTAAHELYEKLGFVRDPANDMDITPEIQLWAFRLPLATGSTVAS
jgi:ribosomal protein S18 acetylase RimI-like enzyme